MQRIYGDPVAHSFGLRDVPRLETGSLPNAQIAINRMSLGKDRLGWTPTIPAEDTFVAAVYLTDLPYHEMRSRGRTILRQGYRANGLRIVHLGEEFSAYVAAPHEALTLYIPRGALDDIAEEAELSGVRHLACDAGVVDPVVARTVAALLPAFDRPGEVGSLYAEHMALALCAHLVTRYGSPVRVARMAKGGLSSRQAVRAKTYIRENLASDFGLAEMARHCGMSRAHFARAFKTSIGITPHRYLLEHRIAQAKAMMMASDLPIAEIAVACGFVDQSHITRVFRRLVGASPARWRRDRRS